ncbi:MAG TPA: NAD(+)/NADH kinase [Patescibacteria group bacterium]|nr:NAD(+)/NADH kinase [Patescibacteria group bacterium]
MIRSVGIFARPLREKIGPRLPELVQWLKDRKIEVFCDRFAAEFTGAVPLAQEELMARIDLLVVLGGDGTLLTAAHAASERDVPVLPVNFGKLGFLTTVALEELYPTLGQVLGGEYETWTHMMLEAEVSREGQATERRRALNDAVLNKGLPAHMIEFQLLVDDQFVCNYRADGIIFSTPTGSTGYSLSAGGPIVSPVIEAMVVTPVCPHMLSNRPLVLPSTARLAAQLTAGDEPAYLTVDGQIAAELRHGDTVRVRRSEKHLRLVRPPQRTYFEVLRNKLRWGEQ